MVATDDPPNVVVQEEPIVEAPVPEVTKTTETGRSNRGVKLRISHKDFVTG